MLKIGIALDSIKNKDLPNLKIGIVLVSIAFLLHR